MSLHIFRLGLFLLLLIGCGSDITHKQLILLQNCKLMSVRVDDERLVSSFRLDTRGARCSLIYQVTDREYQRFLFADFKEVNTLQSDVFVTFFKYWDKDAKLSEIARFVWLIGYYTQQKERPYSEDTGLGMKKNVDGNTVYHVGKATCTFMPDGEIDEGVYQLKQELKGQKFELEFSGAKHTVMCSQDMPLFLAGAPWTWLRSPTGHISVQFDESKVR